MNDYESKILEALQTAVMAAVGNSPNPPVKYVNVDFDPPSGQPWWEVVYIPNNVTGEFWSEGKTYQGVLRLILHWPQNNDGAYEPMNEVARIANQFQKGNKYADSGNAVNVKIQEHPNATGVIEDSPNLLLPLTVRYSCFKVQ